jgi:hypothetical protein
MDQAVKFAIGIASASAVMAVLMFATSNKSFKNKKEVNDAEIETELNKLKPVTSPENKPLLIQGVKDLLQGTNIDLFYGLPDAQFNNLSGSELKSLAQAIYSKKDYKSESHWRQSEPNQYANLMSLASKVIGKKQSL